MLDRRQVVHQSLVRPIRAVRNIEVGLECFAAQFETFSTFLRRWIQLEQLRQNLWPVVFNGLVCEIGLSLLHCSFARDVEDGK